MGWNSIWDMADELSNKVTDDFSRENFTPQPEIQKKHGFKIHKKNVIKSQTAILDFKDIWGHKLIPLYDDVAVLRCMVNLGCDIDKIPIGICDDLRDLYAPRIKATGYSILQNLHVIISAKGLPTP